MQRDAVRLAHELVVRDDKRLREAVLPVDRPDAVGVIEKCPNGRVSGEQSPSEGGGTASLS